MAGTYPNKALDLRAVAKEMFHSLPGWMQYPLRTIRSVFKQTIALLRPTKVVRTLAYHGYLYRVGRVEFAGLHLGSSEQRIPGFLNIDADAFLHCDVVAGLEKLRLNSESVEIIYASHVFEHFAQAKIVPILKEWFRVLKPGGKLFLCVPDLEVLADIYLSNLPNYENDDARYLVDLACSVMYGGQSNKYDFHYSGYSLTTLNALLQSVGFRSVERFDRSALAFAPFGDAAFATIKDIPISLNVKAIK